MSNNVLDRIDGVIKELSVIKASLEPPKVAKASKVAIPTKNKLSVYGNPMSGIPGIYWRPKSEKWIVHPLVDGERYYFGLFEDLTEAKRVLSVEMKALRKYQP